MAASTTWFRFPRSKVHLLQLTDKNFPGGRAACAPFPMLKTDTVHTTNEVNASDFCRFCVNVVANKKIGA